MRGIRIDLPDGRRLDSWKEIAAYLGRHERTAIRWEKKKGLPVHRVPGGERQAVFAFTAELDAWLRREDPAELAAIPQGLKPASSAHAYGTTEVVPFPQQGGKSSFSGASEGELFPSSLSPINSGGRKLRYYALAGLATVSILFFVLLGLRFRESRSSFPVRVDFTLNALQAFDDRGGVLWTHTFPSTLDASVLARPLNSYSHIGDFRGKGEREVLTLASVHAGLNASDPPQTEVDLFSSRGELVWSYVPRGRFQFGKHEVNGPWAVMELFVSSRAGRPQIWAAVNHLVWGNSFVVNLDPATGRDTLRYVNTGTTYALTELKTPQGTFLLAGGFNNEADAGSLASSTRAKLLRHLRKARARDISA